MTILPADYEPNVQQHHDELRWGWHYVRYLDGSTTPLMGKREAQLLTNVFGGEVRKHALAPRWWQFWISPSFVVK